MATLKLHYFDTTGRAYPIRFGLEAANVPYENVLVSMDPAHRQHYPTQQVPVLEVDGKYLCQTNAIMSYLGPLTGMMPTDPWEEAKVMELLGCLSDVYGAIAPSMWEKDPEKKKMLREKFLTFMGKWLPNIDRILKANGTKFACSDKLTFFDVSLYYFVRTIQKGQYDHIPTDLADSHPDIMRVYNLVLNSEDKKIYDSKVKESWQ
eukprot:GHVO01051547.1.p2 GENE.GHVO01051547.1~~GHVO01051547.1.p2  ORF type:complete len:206 (+),score=28.32 GHVO01051547.1:85-702(+)